ncbi:hypothetical protein A2U01_0022675 [Trifolium medium]|uniref:Uncharacterized protein n=1 Tax=Trifolium medium TaxID=97028 RepID=A0A392NP18_9FABA|nr:hypothetical protein [Trifolium medium]
MKMIMNLSVKLMIMKTMVMLKKMKVMMKVEKILVIDVEEDGSDDKGGDEGNVDGEDNVNIDTRTLYHQT